MDKFLDILQIYCKNVYDAHHSVSIVGFAKSGFVTNKQNLCVLNPIIALLPLMLLGSAANPYPRMLQPNPAPHNPDIKT